MRKYTVIKMVFFMLYAFLPYVVYGSDSTCLSLSEDRFYDKKQEFIDSIQNLKTDSSVKIYSAQFDLNRDGNPEYFYFVSNNTYFCGQQSGCPVNVYEFKSNKFRELFKYGIRTPDEFDPENPEYSNFICIGDSETSGWRDIAVTKKDKWIARYNGKEYFLTRDD